MDNFSDIKIGSLIEAKVQESEINTDRICNFFKCTEDKIEQMYLSKSLDSDELLRWSKLLKYDFFRIYSQHLILYSPPTKSSKTLHKSTITIPQFRKNIYTMELINFILELIDSGEKTSQQIIKDYQIPKTTLYKWLKKYN